MTSIWLSVLICILPFAAGAEGLPPLTLPDGVGVNIHFVQGHETDLNMIAAAGFKIVRMDFFWSAIERKEGIYDWSAYDKLTANLERHGLRPYYILDYSNPLYEKGGPSPRHPESVGAFARWAGAAARHFRGHHVIWEIWNEPNGGFWKPHPDAAQYTALALAAAKSIRAADPHACIVAPACAGFDWDFLEAVMKSGLLDYLDGVSVHPYRAQPPETAGQDFQRLRKLIARYAPPGRKIPILSGEWGYSSHTGSVSERTQAEYAVRQQLSNLLDGVPVSIWYDWKNDGANPAENEQNFGTVTRDLKPKPAYSAIQTLTRELSGDGVEGRRNTGNEKDWVLVLTNALGQTKIAAWTLDVPHTVRFDSSLKLQLDSMPQYGNGSVLSIIPFFHCIAMFRAAGSTTGG